MKKEVESWRAKVQQVPGGLPLKGFSGSFSGGPAPAHRGPPLERTGGSMERISGDRARRIPYLLTKDSELGSTELAVAPVCDCIL